MHKTQYQQFLEEDFESQIMKNTDSLRNPAEKSHQPKSLIPPLKLGLINLPDSSFELKEDRIIEQQSCNSRILSPLKENKNIGN